MSHIGGVVELFKALVLKINLRFSYISSLEDNLSYSYELVTALYIQALHVKEYLKLVK